MKAGKEAVMGAIAAAERWARRDHVAVEAAVEERAAATVERLSGLPGVSVAAVRDDRGNPFSRVVLTVDPAACGHTAHGLAQTLAQGDPRILLRSLYADRGLLQLDVRRLDAAALDLVCARIAAAVAMPPGTTAKPPAPQTARPPPPSPGWDATRRRERRERIARRTAETGRPDRQAFCFRAAVCGEPR